MKAIQFLTDLNYVNIYSALSMGNGLCVLFQEKHVLLKRVQHGGWAWGWEVWITVMLLLFTSPSGHHLPTLILKISDTIFILVENCFAPKS